jgi:hypothetical protein
MNPIKMTAMYMSSMHANSYHADPGNYFDRDSQMSNSDIQNRFHLAKQRTLAEAEKTQGEWDPRKFGSMDQGRNFPPDFGGPGPRRESDLCPADFALTDSKLAEKLSKSDQLYQEITQQIDNFNKDLKATRVAGERSLTLKRFFSEITRIFQDKINEQMPTSIFQEEINSLDYELMEELISSIANTLICFDKNEFMAHDSELPDLKLMKTIHNK